VPDTSEECPECGFPFDSLDLEDEDTEPVEREQAGRPLADLARDAAGMPSVAGGPEGQPAWLEGHPGVVFNNPVDSEYIVRAIVSYISDVKVDLVNKPIKAFIQILTELDNSNAALQEKVTQQGADTLAGVQESAQATVSEITKFAAQQALETTTKSQELALTIVSEITAATTALKEAQGALAAELSNSIKQVAAQPASPAPVPQSAPPAAAQPAEVAPASSDMSEYILYLCIGMLVFTIANLFITIYAVKLIK
jgi:hypothetical protein